MFIETFPSGPFITNAYVVACERTREAAIIDSAPDSSKAILSFLDSQGFNCKKILLTHSHWDHIAEVKFLKDERGLSIYIHTLDVPNLQQPGVDGLPCRLTIPGVQPDVLLEGGMHISLGELTFEVLHTPGHSPGSICFYEPKQHVLFTGDTLFHGTIGNLSFPTSQPSLMWPSLAKLAKLPPETRIFSGHGEATTIKAESSWLYYAQELFA